MKVRAFLCLFGLTLMCGLFVVLRHTRRYFSHIWRYIDAHAAWGRMLPYRRTPTPQSLKLTCNHINAAIFLILHLSLCTYKSAWMPYLISFVWASSSCAEQEASEKFKIKIFIHRESKQTCDPSLSNFVPLTIGPRWHLMNWCLNSYTRLEYE